MFLAPWAGGGIDYPRSRSSDFSHDCSPEPFGTRNRDKGADRDEFPDRVRGCEIVVCGLKYSNI